MIDWAQSKHQKDSSNACAPTSFAWRAFKGFAPVQSRHRSTAHTLPAPQPVEMIARYNFQTHRNILNFEPHQDPQSIAALQDLQEYKTCRNNTCDSSVVDMKIYLGYLNLYYIPMIIVVGVVGNFLSFLVLLTTHLKVRSSSYYLAALAVSDSGYLASISLMYFSSHGVFDWYHKDGFCPLWVYFTYVCSFLSVWFIVAFTVERFIAVRYPLRKPYICTVSRAKLIVLSLTCAAFLLHLYVFWIAKVVEQQCHLNPDYLDVATYFNYADTVVTFLVPVGLIVGMNALIARSLLRFRKSTQRGVLDDFESRSENCELYEMNNTQSTSSTKKSKENHSSPDIDSGRLTKITSEKICSQKNNRISIRTTSRYAMSVQVQKNINKMLMVITSVFIILNFPSYLLRICAYFEEILHKHIDPDYMDCAQQFAMLLYYTNFSVNFLLYTMCGETFRLCLSTVFQNILFKLTRLLRWI